MPFIQQTNFATLIYGRGKMIINQLDSEKYRNDQGHQDMNKIRTDLEKWLESKQLLKVVMDRD
ncbi:hypothetical protein SH601_05090 [Gracilibacillus sp. S3-1-1]|uniref:Uncharacterized protein n=1 Tax=Gracilibacillus pellucidus TaxID=3095368 RepID=A0ACC6M327_9BACI|nr:hypothetical protein [Gracilibacillus sp. S3-1-1]MDX8045359.1 hypothetical protein [Gracilibacillus sp. S3-1-1]